MMNRSENRGRERAGMATALLLIGLLLAALAAAPSTALAHGGEDHGAAEAAPVSRGTGEGELTTYGTAGRFELLLKYPPPEADKPTRLRFFLADYTTNKAVAGANFVVSSRPRGFSTQAPPKMVSPGIYELVAVFPEDTVYSLVATLASGDASERIELPNVYAGEPARRFLAEHGGAVASADGENGGGGWLIPLVIVGAAILGISAFLGVRSRIPVKGKPPVTPRTDETGIPQTTSIPESREEENR